MIHKVWDEVVEEESGIWETCTALELISAGCAFRETGQLVRTFVHIVNPHTRVSPIIGIPEWNVSRLHQL